MSQIISTHEYCSRHVSTSVVTVMLRPTLSITYAIVAWYARHCGTIEEYVHHIRINNYDKIGIDEPLCDRVCRLAKCNSTCKRAPPVLDWLLGIWDLHTPSLSTIQAQPTHTCIVYIHHIEDIWYYVEVASTFINHVLLSTVLAPWSSVSQPYAPLFLLLRFLEMSFIPWCRFDNTHNNYSLPCI